MKMKMLTHLTKTSVCARSVRSVLLVGAANHGSRLDPSGPTAANPLMS